MMRAHDETTGPLVPTILVAVGLALMLVQAVFVYVAVRSDPGVVTPNAYERGLAHNTTLRAAAAEAALGWRIEVENRSAAAHAGHLVVTVTDGAGRGLADLSVSGVVARPTRTGFDGALAFAARGDGRYDATYDLPLPGLWQLDLLLVRGDAVVRHATRFVAP